jgi:hypothetical protein
MNMLRSLVKGPIASASTNVWILSGTWAGTWAGTWTHGQKVKAGVQRPYTGVGAENARQIDRSFDSEEEASMATPGIADETGRRVVTLVLLLTALLAGPIAIVATFAKSQTRDELAAAREVDASAVAPIAYPTDSGDIGSFAFGYVEFDVDPRTPGGVPGFDSWPPSSRRQ